MSSINQTFSAVAVALLLLAMTGCALQSPVPALEADDLPATFTTRSDTNDITWPESDWWQNFGDAELTSLVEQVQAGNLDLANNQRNLLAAQIALREAGFNLLPRASLTVGTDATYRQSRIDGVRESNNADSPFALTAAISYTDILSKPAIYTQALADYDSRAAQTADVTLTTLGTSASTYFQLLLTRDKLTAAAQNVSNAQAISEIADARVEAGVAVPIEALQQRIALQRELANQRALQQSDLAARASLALLTGQNVQGLNLSGQTLQPIEAPQVQPGLPSELLLRRPDLVQAEAQLRSAVAGVDIARSDYFPSISLTGSLNASSTSLSELVAAPDLFINSAATIVQTLLDTGQRSRTLERSRLTMENSLATYRRTVLAAFNEVEVLLSAMQLQQEQVDVALQNLGAAEESFRIAQVRYEEGVSDFLTVLTTQNTLFSSRNAYLDAKLQQLNTVISLYQALGGGWQASDIERLNP
ncbi:MAG: efflux transporter outer membrane subunit [Gammaproteobacteria bacterium]|nr:efflux transporter outer membrane subunit [Gammaproteobacteria bacterium]MDP2139784.1 efflux transporter outer membrane subunit [Gammaproteobacteria bacterium]MDP2346399.1 efflux transporter outer membrane subunit [Gammaproteobacteria bacterium]